jgi:hypothetical protein
VIDTLGATYTYQGRFNKARQLHEAAIKGMTRTLGTDHENTLITLDNLGKVMLRYFCYDKAQDLHLKVMTRMERTLSLTDLRTLSAIENAALTYTEHRIKHLNSVHKIIVRVLKERRKKLSKEYLYTLLATINLSRIKTALH